MAAEDEWRARAAVALIFRVASEGALELLLIKRAEYPGDPWSGQVAFPGGREEAGDASLAETAIRETREETGIELEPRRNVLGSARRFAAAHHRDAEDRGEAVRGTTGAKDRSSSAPKSRSPSGFRSDRATRAPSRGRRRHVFTRGIQVNARASRHEDHIVWGMTERISTQLMELICSVATLSRARRRLGARSRAEGP